jgi:hypothetical protein
MLRHVIGEVIEVESLPMLQGPVPRVRVRFNGRETSPWEMSTMFEFAVETDGFRGSVRR